jgi:hypothetical protein
MNCNKFPKICLKEFRHVSQQRADILNIFYDGEYNINYYIWLIINEGSKQCVLPVPAVRQNFSRQVTHRFCRKLPTVNSVSNQPALWTRCIYNASLYTIFHCLWLALPRADHCSLRYTMNFFFQKLKPSGSLNLGCDLLGMTLCSLVGDYWFRGTCCLIPWSWRLLVSLKHITAYQIIQCQPSRMQYKFSPSWQPKISDFSQCTTIFSLLLITFLSW